MRFWLNLAGPDLAYSFGLHSSTISRTFSHIGVLWPDRDTLLKNMPVDFRKHCPRCVVIIDCFEIFLERPTNLLDRAQTYSVCTSTIILLNI